LEREQLTTDLKRLFGFDRFNSGQEDVILSLLSGHSAAAIFPTGGGKSLCYQLPAILLPGLTVVVSPLIALMKDQVRGLDKLGIRAGRFESGQSAEEVYATTDGVRNGSIKILYVSPERFNNENFRDLIADLQISLFAVDEAHCISEWGHNFRPDYLKLSGYAKDCGAERILALTATATPQVLDDICQSLEITKNNVVRTPFHRPNLELDFANVRSEARDDLLYKYLKEKPAGATIVYVTLQKTAEKVADYLAFKGFEAKYYHAGLYADERAKVQDWFLQSKTGVVVATIAFGMGVDKGNIRYVCHYNLPKSIENYAQEIGRAGRDGKHSVCKLFGCAEDLNVLENFAYADTPSDRDVAAFLDDIFSRGEYFRLGLVETGKRHDMKAIVVKTLLTYMEMEGFLQGGTPIYSVYEFQEKRPRELFLSEMPAEQRQLCERVLAAAKKARLWYRLDADIVAANLGEERERVVEVLVRMGSKGFIQLKPSRIRLPYRLIKAPDALVDYQRLLFQRLVDREAAEIKRIHQVVELISLESCQSMHLSAYFGDQVEGGCGHCCYCREGSPIAPINHPVKQLSKKDRKLIETYRADHPDTLSDPRVMARFLCGISSPRLLAAKLTRNRGYGALSHVPFQVLLEA